MVINSIQYGMKLSIVVFWALLTAPVKLLVESKILFLTAVSPGVVTDLNSSRSHWQRLDSLITISWNESPA